MHQLRPTASPPPPISLRNAWGETALLHPWGGQLLHWRSAHGVERLYLSPLAPQAGRAAVRGGVPVVFPQFGRRGPLPAHGFARTRWWQALPRTRPSLAGMRLHIDCGTDALWPHDAQLTLWADIGVHHTLSLRLELHNPGPEPLSFAAALHSYLALDARRALLQGIGHDALALHGPLDQIHPAAPGALNLRGRGPGLRIEQEGFAQTVVWNPGPAHALSDLPRHGWRRFACVEAAQVEPVTLAPGDTWVGTQTLRQRSA